MANRLNFQALSSAVDIVKYNIYRSMVGVRSGNSGPFALSDGMTLIVDINQSGDQTIAFATADFADIGAATAEEVASVITRDLGSGFAHKGEAGDVFIRSSDENGSVEVNGGTANAVFGFGNHTASSQSHFFKIAEVPNPAEGGVIEYIDNDGSVYDYYKISSKDQSNQESAPTAAKQAAPCRQPVCLIHGKLIDGRGFAIPDQEVKAVIDYPPGVHNASLGGVTREEISTLSQIDGTFEFELIQGGWYRVEIPAVEFARVVNIPDEATANLFDLEFEEKDSINPGGDGDSFNF